MSAVSLEDKFKALDHIYRVYGEFCDNGVNAACREGCAHCCTQNVTLTTLEARYLRSVAEANGCDLPPAADFSAEPGAPSSLCPATTINQTAEAMRRGIDPSAFENGDDGDQSSDLSPALDSPCRLLTEDRCSLYAGRPFACRCMMSVSECRSGGSAEMPPLVLSINTVVIQTIEHVDRGGFTGNIADVLAALEDPEFPPDYQDGMPPRPGLLPNHPMTIMMIPPEHRQAAAPFIQRLHSL